MGSASFGCEWKQRHMSGPLYRLSELSLMFGTGARRPLGGDLAFLIHIASKLAYVFVVNISDLINAEGTKLAPSSSFASTTIFIPVPVPIAVSIPVTTSLSVSSHPL